MLEIVRCNGQRIVLTKKDGSMLGTVKVSTFWELRDTGLYEPVTLTQWQVSRDIKILRSEIFKTDGK